MEKDHPSASVLTLVNCPNILEITDTLDTMLGGKERAFFSVQCLYLIMLKWCISAHGKL